MVGIRLRAWDVLVPATIFVLGVVELLSVRPGGWEWALLLEGLACVVLVFRRIWPLAALIPVFALLPPFGRASGGKVEYLAWCVATLVLVHVVFFGEDRYLVVVTPAMVLLAASALRPRPEPTS